MDKAKFEAMLILIVPPIIKYISTELKISELEATDLFYKSKTYEQLEDEETKLWHFSPLTLYNMFSDENKFGIINYPEET